MRIGFIGIGTMGSRMARNLLNAGHTLTVHDIDPAATAQLRESGATWSDTPKAVAERSEVVFTSLPGPKEVQAVALGDDGILEGIQRGAVFVDLSTNAPSTVRRIAEQMAGAGASMLDAPVSGGPMGAESGTLAIMVGGDEEAFRRVRPVLEVLGKDITYVGATGSGTIAKLVHNAISMTTRIVIQEGMTLAVKAGVSPTKMLEVLTNASFGKQLVLTRHIPELVFKGDFDHPRFSLGLSEKDVRLALELADEVGVPMEAVRLAQREIQEAMARGWAQRDNLVTFLLAEERAGVQVRA